MEQIISKEEFDELMKVEGEVRGTGMKNHAEFIVQEEGEEGLKELEDTITKLGYPIKYRELKSMGFYPLGLETVTLVAIKKLFNFDDKKFQEMGELGTKLSLILRLFMKHFVFSEKLIKEASKIWKKGGAVGDLKVVEFDKGKRYLILGLEGFPPHPLYCQVFKGYFSSGLQMILGVKPACEETKCVFRGDDYHEFSLKW